MTSDPDTTQTEDLCVQFEFEDNELLPGEPNGMRKRTYPAVLRIFKHKENFNPDLYYFSELLLYKPHRHESELFANNIEKCFALYTEPVECDRFHNTKSKILFVKEQVMEHLQGVDEARMYVESTQKELNLKTIGGDLDSYLEQENDMDDRDYDVPDERFEFLDSDNSNLKLDTCSKTVPTPVYESMFRPIFVPDNINEKTRKLDPDQRLVLNKVIEYCYRLVQCRKYKTSLPQPLLLMVHGGAGAGKSSLIRLIAEWVQKIMEKPGDHPFHPYIIKTAPTGTAANLIDGQTIHSTFGFSFQNRYTSLPGKKLAILRDTFENVSIVIIDEVSMVKSEQLYELHLRLNELGRLENPNEIFGGKSIIMFGDIMQLPPVQGKYIFQPPSSYPIINDVTTGTLWNLFDIINLTYNHRQGNEKEYANLLNRIRLNQQTMSDMIMLQTRIRPIDHLDVQTITHIKCTKACVKHYNDKRLNIMQGDLFTIKAQYFCDTSNKYQPRISNFDSHINDMSFLDTLELKVGCQVMLIYNIDTSDWLTNGSRGFLQNFHIIANELIGLVIKFENNKAGTQWKLSNKDLSNKYPGCVVIKKLLHSFSAARKTNKNNILCNAKLLQFPVVLSFAATAHKFQGQSILKPEKIAIDLNDVFQAGQAYVMLSRVESIEQLYILDSLDVNKIYARQTALEAFTAMNLRALNGKSIWKTKDVENDIIIGVLNIMHFITHLNDLKTDTLMLNCDIIILSETWLSIDQNALPLSDFQCIVNSQGFGKGLIIYWKICKISFIPTHWSTKTCQVTILNNTQCDIIAVYRSTSDITLLPYLSTVINSTKPTLIVGDFNLDIVDDVNHCLLLYLKNEGFTQHVDKPTHILGRIIDHIYTKSFTLKEIKSYQPYYSDHSANILKINLDNVS